MEVGSFITLSHVDGVPSIHGIIAEVLGNSILVKSITSLKIADNVSFDTLRLAVQNKNQIYFYDCSVKLIGKHHIKINILGSVSEYITDGRKEQRVPLFINGLCSIENQGCTIPITLINLSASGACFISSESIPEDQELNVGFAIENTPFNIKARVVWKSSANKLIWHGIFFNFEDYNTRNMLKVYLSILRQEYLKIKKDNREYAV